MGCMRHGTARIVAIPCPVPSWCQLWPNRWPSVAPGKSTHPSQHPQCSVWWTSFGIFATSFSVYINALAENFQIKWIELKSEIQLRALIMSLYQTSVSPLFPEENIPRFTVTPYSRIHIITFWQHTHLWTSFQGWSTGRVKFHQKSLMNTLRTH